MLIERDKWDIGTTAIKGELIGCQLKLADGNWHTVIDWYIDHAIRAITVVFEDDTFQFTLSNKFEIRLPDTIVAIKDKKIGRINR